MKKRHQRRSERRGIILILALVVVALLSLAAYSFSQWMLGEYKGSRVQGRLVQARSLVESGMEHIKLIALQDAETRKQMGGVYDNPAYFQAQLVVDSDRDRDRGRFTVVSRLIEDGQFTGIRFGLEDESTRLNLNALELADASAPDGGRTLLMALPGMTEDIADAILDFIDADEDPREFGCEADYYAGLSPAYAPPNAPLKSVEELLRVRGVTPELLFGADVNRNGMIDASEEEQAAAFSGVDADGGAALGWAAYLTLYSQERNLDPDGLPKIDLNNSDLNALYNQLAAVFPQEWVTYIVAYRLNGEYTGSNTSDVGATGELDLTQQPRFRINQVLDLIGKRVQVQFVGGDERYVLESPFPDDLLAYGLYLPALMDHVAANVAPIIPGRININQAPKTILLGIPGMNESIVNEIVSRRSPEPTDVSPGRRHETWLLNEGIVTLDEMKAILPYVCAGGSVYRAQIVGYFDREGPAVRAEAVIDATSAAGRLLFWREMSHLGRGYPLESLGVEVRE